MELQLLLILVVAFLVFGPEKMLEFATQLGRLVRKIRQEWASIQMEAEMARLKEELNRTSLEGERKVRSYLSGETETRPKTQKEFLKEFLSEERTENSRSPKERKDRKSLSMEDLVSGGGPVVDDGKKFSQG